MPTKSNVFMNWTGVTVTPSGGSAITLTEVTDIDLIDSDTLEMWQADGHKFPTLCIAADAKRGMTIHGGDVYKLAALPKNTPCTIVAVLNDAVNKAGVGSMTVTLSNAVVADTSAKGQTNKFAGGQVSFAAFSPDGTTDPLAIAQA